MDTVGANMIIEIGIVAGEIWRYLDEKQTASLEETVTALGRSREMVLLSVGWLAREGHVVLKDEKGYQIALKK